MTEIADASSVGRWLALSIGATVLCCMPLGIVGIVYSALAMGARDRGDWYTMSDYVSKARGWTVASIVLGLLVIVCALGSRYTG